MNTKSLAASFIILALFISAAPIASGQDQAVKSADDTRAQAIQKALEAIHESDETDFPGAVFSIVWPNDTVQFFAVGVSDRETGRPFESNDKLMSASIGKTYFAAMAVDLIGKGQLSLDDKVSKYLGDESWFERIPNAEDLRIQHLLRHQTGIPRYVLKRELWDKAVADPDMTWQAGDQLTYIYDQKPLHPAGKGWAYSDTNYIILGLVMQEVTGMDVYEYVEANFLKPNKLENTAAVTGRKIDGLVQGYTQVFQAFGLPEKMVVDGQMVFNPSMEWCGGGFASSSSDLARWTHVYFSGKAMEGDYVDRLIKDAADASRMLGPNSSYGLGVIIRETELGTSLGHDGGFPGYTSSTAYFADHDVSAALMINTDGQKMLGRPVYSAMLELVKVALEK